MDADNYNSLLPNEPALNLPALLADYATKRRERDTLAAPFSRQIQLLEQQKAEATAALTFELETLEALIKPLVLATQCTQKIPGVTASYIQKPGWDNDMLKAMAEELPAILQAYKPVSFVTLRLTR